MDVFGHHYAGDSNAWISNNAQLLQLTQPRAYSLRRWLIRLVRFSTVEVTGLVINTAVFVGATVASLSYLLAAMLGMQIATAWNFLLAERFVFSAPPRSTLLTRAGGFFLSANASFAFGGPVLIILVRFLGIAPIAANIVSISAMFLARFVIADRFIWRPASTLQPTQRGNAEQPEVHAADRGMRHRHTPTLSPLLDELALRAAKRRRLARAAGVVVVIAVNLVLATAIIDYLHQTQQTAGTIRAPHHSLHAPSPPVSGSNITPPPPETVKPALATELGDRLLTVPLLAVMPPVTNTPTAVTKESGPEGAALHNEGTPGARQIGNPPQSKPNVAPSTSTPTHSTTPPLTSQVDPKLSGRQSTDSADSIRGGRQSTGRLDLARGGQSTGSANANVGGRQSAGSAEANPNGGRSTDAAENNPGGRQFTGPSGQKPRGGQPTGPADVHPGRRQSTGRTNGKPDGSQSIDQTNPGQLKRSVPPPAN